MRGKGVYVYGGGNKRGGNVTTVVYQFRAVVKLKVKNKWLVQTSVVYGSISVMWLIKNDSGIVYQSRDVKTELSCKHRLQNITQNKQLLWWELQFSNHIPLDEHSYIKNLSCRQLEEKKM